MFQPGSTAPTDGRPVLWLYDDGGGATIMFFMHGFWWEVDEEYKADDPPYADAVDMENSKWRWIDLPLDILARCMRFVIYQVDEISTSRAAKSGFFMPKREPQDMKKPAIAAGLVHSASPVQFGL
jgi:hypothetical protein